MASDSNAPGSVTTDGSHSSRDATRRHALEILEYERVREALMAYAASPLGKSLIRKMAPLRRVPAIRRALQETDEMRALIRHSRVPLAGLRDIAAEVDHLADDGRPGDAEFLYAIVDLLRTALSVKALLTENASALPALAGMVEGIEDIPELRLGIPEKIDPQDGVRDDASERLASLRREIRELRKSLDSRATRILSTPSLRRAFQSEGVSVQYDRYLLPVKAEYRSWIKGPIRDRSKSGSTLYVEPDEITYDGERLLELLDSERDEVQRLLWELMRQVLDCRPALGRTQTRLSWVDYTFAKASYAEAFGLVTPEINEEGVLDLKEARHLHLLWLARDVRKDPRSIDLEGVRANVVPINVRLGDGFRVLIITGPNTGGKTVALKTVGLSALMALSGVPISAAEGSRVPLYTNVFADIGDEQSLEQSLSTFSSHLTHLIEILRAGDPQSLILLDELGAGTDPVDGAALGRALLDRFVALGWSAMITTHISSLKEYAYDNAGAENAAMEFDDRTLRPTYRLLMGIPGSSNALAIARRMGLDETVLSAAEAEIARVEEPTREIISRMEKSRRRVEKERRRVERVRRRVQGTAKEYDQRLQELDAERQAIELEADIELDRHMRAAKERLQRWLSQLQNLPQSHRNVVEGLTKEVEQLVAQTPLGEKREAFARALKRDDEVYVPKFRERARVRKIDKGGRTLTVILNGLPVEIDFDDVSWLENPPSVHEKG